MRHFSALLLFFACGQALAWGKAGHELVGELAERQLTPAARTQVRALLADEPDPSLAAIASWADDVREGNSELGRRSSPWHYINYPRGAGCDYAPARDCANGDCVVGAINRNFLVVSDRKRPRAERAEALKFLVHFVGDVHQPLHAGFAHDRGGNDHQVNHRGKGTNLHQVWDYWLVRQRGLKTAPYASELLARAPLPADPTGRSDRPAVDWATESCRIVQSTGFYPPRGKLAEAYLVKHQPLAELRLRRAGQRLARLLNHALK